MREAGVRNQPPPGEADQVREEGLPGQVPRVVRLLSSRFPGTATSTRTGLRRAAESAIASSEYVKHGERCIPPPASSTNSAGVESPALPSPSFPFPSFLPFPSLLPFPFPPPLFDVERKINL